MRARVAAGMLVLQLAGVSLAGAQTYDHLSIDIEGWTIHPSGGERPNTAMSSGPIVIGKTTSAGFAKLPTMCGFAVAASVRPGAISGWEVAVTPIRVDDDAVTFRLHWVRSRDEGRDTSRPGGDGEVTLRPGESMTLDMVPLSPAVTMPYEQCGVRATSLRVGINYRPRPNSDRRLTETELWLVERRSDGSERSQALSVRGLFNHPSSFFFDTVSDGAVSLDLFGDVTLSTAGGEFVAKLNARGRITESGNSSTTLRDGALGRSRQVESVIRIAPGEVIALELPRLSDNNSGAFADRTFSIRIRSRQIR